MAVKKISNAVSPKTVNKSAAVKVAGKQAEASKVTANPRLVVLFKKYEGAKSEAQGFMVSMCELCQKEQLTREEIIASIMEAKDLNRKSAGEAYARISRFLNKPDILQDLKDGKYNLKEAKEKLKAAAKRTRVLSPKEVQKNAEKTITSSFTKAITAAKNSGMDMSALVNTLKEMAKKAGIK